MKNKAKQWLSFEEQIEKVFEYHDKGVFNLFDVKERMLEIFSTYKRYNIISNGLSFILGMAVGLSAAVFITKIILQ